jgi:hypothetical protein
VNVMEDKENVYQLINAEAQERLSKADIILQFVKIHVRRKRRKNLPVLDARRPWLA